MCRAPWWCGRGLDMGALLPPGGLCAPPGVFTVVGPLQCAGPLVVLSWVTVWPCWFFYFGGGGAFLPPCVWACGAWLLGIDITAAVAPFFTLFLSSVLHLLSLHLCLPTEIRRCIFSPPIVTVQHKFSLVLLLPDFIFLLDCCLPVSRVYPIMVDSFSGRI